MSEALLLILTALTGCAALTDPDWGYWRNPDVVALYRHPQTKDEQRCEHWGYWRNPDAHILFGRCKTRLEDAGSICVREPAR